LRLKKSRYRLDFPNFLSSAPMPVLKERVLEAKQQRASGASNFDSGLADSLLDLLLDPTYVPHAGERPRD